MKILIFKDMKNGQTRQKEASDSNILRFDGDRRAPFWERPSILQQFEVVGGADPSKIWSSSNLRKILIFGRHEKVEKTIIKIGASVSNFYFFDGVGRLFLGASVRFSTIWSWWRSRSINLGAPPTYEKSWFLKIWKLRRASSKSERPSPTFTFFDEDRRTSYWESSSHSQIQSWWRSRSINLGALLQLVKNLVFWRRRFWRERLQNRSVRPQHFKFLMESDAPFWRALLQLLSNLCWWWDGSTNLGELFQLSSKIFDLRMISQFMKRAPLLTSKFDNFWCRRSL